MQARGGRIAAEVQGDRAPGEPRGERGSIRGVVDQPASFEVLQQVHVAADPSDGGARAIEQKAARMGT